MSTDSSPESAHPEEPEAGKASAAAADAPRKLNNTLASKFDRDGRRARNHAMGMLAVLGTIREQEAEIRTGGGAKAIESQHAKKRLTARERLALLLDPGTELLELGLFAAFGMYE